MPDSGLILTLDIGTSSVRAMLWDERGDWAHGWVSEIRHTMTVSRDGGVVTDPAALLKRTARAIDGVLDQAGKQASRVIGVGIDSFWHSLMGVDAGGRPMTPLYTWADTRSQSAAEELKRRLNEAEVHARTGCTFHSSYLPAKLLWLSKTQPEVFHRARHWLSFGEYLFLTLFGEPLVSVSMASGTGLFDQDTCTWDAPVLAALPIFVDQLGTLVDADHAARGLRKPYAQRWPVLSQAPWFPALGDGACSNAGSNCATDRRMALMVGTSGALRVLSRGTAAPVPMGLWRYRLDREHVVVGGALSNGGNLMRWIEATFRHTRSKAALENVARLGPDAHGLTVLPFLDGERSPDYRADARGAIAGLSLSTTPADVQRACMEAVSYRFAVLAELLAPLMPQAQEVIVNGGAILSRPAWMQIMADVLGQRLIASGEREATSRGAALRALQSLGLLKAVEDAPDRLGAAYEPNAQNHAIYASGLQRHRELYERLLGVGHASDRNAPPQISAGTVPS